MVKIVLATLLLMSLFYLFLRDVWIRTQRAPTVARRACSCSPLSLYLFLPFFKKCFRSRGPVPNLSYDKNWAIRISWNIVKCLMLFRLAKIIFQFEMSDKEGTGQVTLTVPHFICCRELLPESVREKWRLRRICTSHFKGGGSIWGSTEYSAPPLSHINRFTVTPQHTQPPFHYPIMIILGNIPIGLTLALACTFCFGYFCE